MLIPVSKIGILTINCNNGNVSLGLLNNHFGKKKNRFFQILNVLPVFKKLSFVYITYVSVGQKKNVTCMNYFLDFTILELSKPV